MKTITFDDGKTYQLMEINPEKLKQPKTIWDLEEGENFWSINDQNEEPFRTTYFLEIRRDIGNCFLTKPEAEKELKKRQAIQKIRKYIHENDMERGWVTGENNYCIEYDDRIKEFEADYKCYYRGFDYFYFHSKAYAQKIIDNFPDELKLIFDV